MAANGVQGSGLWHGSVRDKFVAIAQPGQPFPVLAFKSSAGGNDLHACMLEK